jgi:hypothetical protein
MKRENSLYFDLSMLKKKLALRFHEMRMALSLRGGDRRVDGSASGRWRMTSSRIGGL